MRLSRVRAGVMVTALLTVVVASAAPPTASAAAPDTAADQSSVTVIARGLNNPRGIAVGRHGWLFVAEAGKGGNGKCIPAPVGQGVVCLGASSALAAISIEKDRDKPVKAKRVVTGLPSVANKDGSFALGLHDIAPVHPGVLLGTIGGAGTREHRAALGKGGKLVGHLVKLCPEKKGDGEVEALADLLAYEARHNPDAKSPGSAVDSNPYGLLALPHRTYVTDAGGNDLIKVDEHGNISTAAVFPARIVPAPPGVPNLPPRIPMQAVPTTVTTGPDGALYVAQLTGFPFPRGGANIWRIKYGEPPRVFASGFTNIVDMAFDGRGGLLVLQISKRGLFVEDPNGALIRIGAKGKRTELAAGKLTAPGGVAVGPDGSIYVTNKSVFAGQGEVLRVHW